MRLQLFADQTTLARAAAAQAAELIRHAIAEHGQARILVATGTSQVAFLEALTAAPNLTWSRVELFQLDEYIGLPSNHPASFCRYLKERLIQPTGLRRYHLLDGETPPEQVSRDVGTRLAAAPVDVAFAGIGENGHLAFNDPPADFTTETPYHIVQLDEACRLQQVREGWFPRLADVPRRAISISVRQLLRARSIISVVPDARKAAAVQRCVEGPISPLAPASILRTHPDVTLYLDPHSAALLAHRPALAV